MDKEKILKTLSEQSSIEWQQPITLENSTLPIFNTDIFPNWLKDYVDAIAEETQTPKDAPAMACISTLSTILGRKYVVQARKNWIEPLNTYTVMALDPANRKSAVFNFFQKPIVEFEKTERERLISIVTEEKAEREVIRKRIIELERQFGRTEDEDNKNILLKEIKELRKKVDEELNPLTRFPRFFTNDATPEKIAVLMYENNECFAILSSEGAEVFEMMAGRYSDKFNIDTYLKAFSGDNITIDRIGDGRSISLENPTLTIGLFVQPSVIQDLPPYFSYRGLTQRFLFFLPKSFIGERKIQPNEIPDYVVNIYNANIKKLIELRLPTQSDPNNPIKSSLPLIFNSEAQQYLTQIQIEIELMFKNQDLNEALKGWLGKLVGQIIRIAGLLHVTEYVQTGTIPMSISKETLMKADSLRDYFIQHAEKAFGIIGQHESLDDVRYILRKIKSKKFDGKEIIDFQEIWQLVKKRFKVSEKLKDVLITLEELNYIKNAKDGRKQIIHVNPYLIKSSPNNPNTKETMICQEDELGDGEILKAPNYPSTDRNELGELVPFRVDTPPSENPLNNNVSNSLGEIGEATPRVISEDGSELI
ncbi:YfjI family protein [Ureibacillus sinduriensis]|uniref:YfjI family protein n=1 Tax=Ureibacillus sinduriensis TaxID=561440 RepID=UPI000B2D4D28|nr:YfjI family protein [Ureibacillus sinduriensis]